MYYILLCKIYFKASICIFLFDLYCKCLSTNALYFSPRDDTNVFCTSNSVYNVYKIL